MFEIGDKVIIKKSEDDLFCIGGIHNHMTREVKKDIFGFYITTSSCWETELKGDIIFMGKYNHYIIRDGNNYYAFCNDYNEMRLQDERE